MALLAAVALTGIPTPVEAASVRQQLAAAKKSRAMWVKREKRARSIIRTRNVTIRDLRADLSQLQTLFNEHDARLNAQMAALVAERDSLVGQVAALRGTVPDQVAAIARTGVPADLQNFVLNPARAAWACGGTVFLGETFFSYDFDQRAPDGTCY